MFGSEERREQMRKRERREREKRTKIMGLREMSGKLIKIYIYIYILQYCYSTILKIELYCSSIAKKITIFVFNIP